MSRKGISSRIVKKKILVKQIERVKGGMQKLERTRFGQRVLFMKIGG